MKINEPTEFPHLSAWRQQGIPAEMKEIFVK
jgi:hypothetical protein